MRLSRCSGSATRHNADLCDDCGICVERCAFQARGMVDSSLAFDSSKCFGCGLCVSKCPQRAISLITRGAI
jgi:MinD superfamily P-loop ATPase